VAPASRNEGSSSKSLGFGTMVSLPGCKTTAIRTASFAHLLRTDALCSKPVTTSASTHQKLVKIDYGKVNKIICVIM